MADDEDIPICPGSITIKDYPFVAHPNRFDATVQCVRSPGHLDTDKEPAHLGWVTQSTSVEWAPFLDGIEVDAESSFINRKIY